MIVDSREQIPLKFKDGVFEEVVVEGVPFGDYWCEVDGVQVPFCFERKTCGDLWGTMTKGYPRFKREMERAKKHGFQMELIIEGSMTEIARGFGYSQFKGESMLKKLAMLRVRHDLPYHFFNTRREMARYIEDVFSAIRRNYKVEKRREGKRITKESAAGLS